MKPIYLLGILIAITFIVGCSKAPEVQKPTQVSDPRTYLACGCGCCPDQTPDYICLYHGKSDDISKIMENDIMIKKSPVCSQMGCSKPQQYRYCD